MPVSGPTMPAAAEGAAPDAARIKVSGVAAVFVTLRWSGLTRGRGQWIRPGLLDRPAGAAPAADAELRQSVDLVAAARSATDAALRPIREQVLENLRQAIEAGREVPADPAEALRRVTAELLVDLQIARTPELVELEPRPPEAHAAALLHQFVAGHHGLILTPPRPAQGGDRAAAGRVGWVWFGDALARNLAPRLQMISLLARAKLDKDQMAGIGLAHGPQLYRFKVIHIARSGRDQPPAQLIRGNEILAPEPLSQRGIESLGRRMAEHLALRQRPNGTMVGTYRPTTGRYDPPDAELSEQALAAYALARWLKLHAAADGPGGGVDRGVAAIGDAVTEAARYLTPRLKGPSGREEIRAAALTIMALIAAPHLADRKVERATLKGDLLDLQEEDG